MFPHDDACAAWLASVRWPEGFECPRCGHDHGWALRGKAHTFECARCHRQTSVTAGTILHGSKLALTVWFWAAYLMATHSNGIAALQLQNQLGIGSYRSAWLLAAKLRKAMVDPERDALVKNVGMSVRQLRQVFPGSCRRECAADGLYDPHEYQRGWDVTPPVHLCFLRGNAPLSGCHPPSLSIAKSRRETGLQPTRLGTPRGERPTYASWPLPLFALPICAQCWQ